uniref:Protein transport protein Sec61 subunit alpha isoform, putative n=1 Tax=Entamoeba invadens TaxID=33085 RepID=S0B2B6_ENTIV|nr:protein transport protein Sec61 subunit alpha isoform, putative [Entamoeba invadens]
MGLFFNIIRPIVSLIPTVKEPAQKVSFKEKLMWTGVTLLIFLVCSQIPLIGMVSSDSSDPFSILRNLMASNRGTLMDLDISPIVTASMVMQLLQGAKIISVNMEDQEESELFEASQKLFGLLMTIGQGLAYIMSGMYGEPSELGLFNCFLILLQLFFAGLVVLLLDELLSNGYGFGSAISLFIATNISESIMWAAFSPTTFSMGNGTQFEGAIINFFHLILTRPDKLGALYDAFFRTSANNLCNLMATAVVFMVVMYYQGYKVDIPLSSKQGRVESQNYSIRLFYTSNMPIILHSALTSNVFIISQLLFRSFPNNFFVNMFGSWSAIGSTHGQTYPVGGLCYYLSAPDSVFELAQNPIHGVVSIALTVLMCTIFSREWIKVSGSASVDVKKQLADQRVSIKGFRDGESSVYLLDKYIPIAASFGGMCISLLSVGADLLGAVGSGTGILLAATTISEYANTFQKEWKKEMGSDFAF